MNPKDLRVIKTSENIRKTFIQLLSEKEFEKITVSELISRARINRSTFYKHYEDKYSLAEAIASDWMKTYKKILDERIATVNPENQLLFVDKLHKLLAEHRDTILALWKIRTERVHVFEDMQSLLEEIVPQFFYESTGKEISEYQKYLLSVIMITNLRFLLENQDTYPQDNVLSELSSLIQFLSDLSGGFHVLKK